MKNIFKKNSIIITALAIMIVIAGYLSFTTRDTNTAKNDKNGTIAQNDNEAIDVDGTDIATTDGTTPNPTGGAADNNTGNDTDNTNTNEDTDTGTTNDTNDTNELGSKDPQNVTDNGDLDLDDGTPGEAVLASADANYFVSAKIKREQVRAQNKADYLKILNSTKATAANKDAATKSMLKLADNKDKEYAAEVLLGAKGFSDALVFINEGKVEVAVNAASLTKQQTAIIEDVVKRKTGISVQNMEIIPVVLQD